MHFRLSRQCDDISAHNRIIDRLSRHKYNAWKENDGIQNNRYFTVQNMHKTDHWRLNAWFWSDTFNSQPKQVHYRNRQMDMLRDQLKTLPIETGWEICIEPFPKSWCGRIDNLDSQLGNGWVLTRTRTRSDCLEPLATLLAVQFSTDENYACKLFFEYNK